MARVEIETLIKSVIGAGDVLKKTKIWCDFLLRKDLKKLRFSIDEIKCNTKRQRKFFLPSWEQKIAQPYVNRIATIVVENFLWFG